MRTMFIAGVVLAVAYAASAAAQETISDPQETAPDPEALLRGVEASREQLPDLSMEMTAQYRNGEIDRTSTASVTFSGDHRRYKIHKDNNLITTIFDGTAYLHYRDKSINSTINAPGKGPPDYVFDPRILGLTAIYSPTTSMRGCLGYEGHQEMGVLGQEVIRNAKAWHIFVLDQYDQRKEFWIEDVAPFRVHRYECRSGTTVDTTESSFDLSVSEVLPVKIETRELRDGSLIGQRDITITKLEAAQDVDDKIFTLAGLDMPVGTAVGDIRKHLRIGYWTGDGLSEDLPPMGSRAVAASVNETPLAVEKDTERRSRFLWINIGLAVLVVLGLVMWRWSASRSVRRSTEAKAEPGSGQRPHRQDGIA